MIPEELRRKLERLNRGPLIISPGRGKSAPEPAPPEGLVELVKGEVAGAPGHEFYLIRRGLHEVLPNADELIEGYRGIYLQGRYVLTREDLERAWSRVVAAPLPRVLFLDIETLGLAGVPLFLIGLLHATEDGDFEILQLFARDYAEEPGVLRHLARAVGDFDVLVTYNGKSFDWPYITDRAAYHAVSVDLGAVHLDLLHEVRRRWKRTLPNCRLQTVEQVVCKRRRVGDIPSELIGEVYHAYVRSGDARRVVDILHHNALDLVTMAEVLAFILRGGELVWE
jgi:uncharacterized protein YprB with RNaseH-like and TPR domain